VVVCNSHLALDKLDALLDVRLCLHLILLDEYRSDELVYLVLFLELAELLGYLFVFAQLRVELLSCFDCCLESCRATRDPSLGVSRLGMHEMLGCGVEVWELTGLKLLILCHGSLHCVSLLRGELMEEMGRAKNTSKAGLCVDQKWRDQHLQDLTKEGRARKHGAAPIEP
jgi:hypothetical protein